MSEREAATRRIQPTLNALYDAAAYLPIGRALIEAHAKRRALMAEERKLTRSGSFSVSRPIHFIEQFYRLQVQIYDDDKALGLTSCLGRPPRPPIEG